METYPFASCGSLEVPRLWPLSPVAAEIYGARWDARGLGGKQVSCIVWGGTQNSHQDLENVIRETD